MHLHNVERQVEIFGQLRVIATGYYNFTKKII